MANNRIFYPIQQIAIKSHNSTTYYPVRGLQSVGVTTNFNLQQVFQIGQLSLYENVEEIPDIQVTLNKVLDGNIPIYCLATKDTTTPTLTNRANQKCNVNLAIFDESLTSASALVASQVSQMETSGMFVSSVRYQFPKDGNFSEEVTLVGNNKVWRGDPRITNTNDTAWSSNIGVSGFFVGTETPAASAGVNRRQDLAFASVSSDTDTNGANEDPDCTILPPDVAGIGSNGVNALTSATRAHLNNISVSVNLNRDNLTELGRKAPYFRTPTFPLEVSTEIEITATSGDLISATESGILSTAGSASCSAGYDAGNLSNRTIRIATCEGLRVYCGLKNKLASVNYNGGDAGGGPVNVSYTFQTFNDFTVLHSGERTLEAGSPATGFWWGTVPNSTVTRSGYLTN